MKYYIFLIFVQFLYIKVGRADSDPIEYLQFLQLDANQHPLGEPLTVQDFKNGENLAPEEEQTTELPNNGSDPILLANFYEGDIAMTSAEFMHHHHHERNGIKNTNQKWTGGIIPYTISADFDSHDRSIVARAMSEFHSRTCVRFKPASAKTDRDSVAIVKGNGCSSHVGRLGKQQTLSLGSGCLFIGIALHEMMHVVGFWHEQSRPDRDEFVTIYYDNVKEGMAYNFNKQNWNSVQNLSQKYDTSSIMHYGPYAFTKGKGLPTILPNNPNQQIGQRKDFSVIDVAKINALYKCQQQTGQQERLSTERPPEGITGSTNCQDKREHCKYWSESGECSKNPNYMKQNCKKSCGFCEGCVDSNRHCPYWSSIGECSKNPTYMQTHCKLSCNMC